jgi:hypothetical protein
MLDDLRNSSSYIDEEETPEQEQDTANANTAREQNSETFLGMTAQQRFILSLMMFFMICALGVFALIITGSIVVPGL